MTSTPHLPSLRLLTLPSEIILTILAYLDLPDQHTLSQMSDILERLSEDPALHRNRILVVAPSRVDHSLGGPCRPAFGDLVERGVARGLGLDRRWRMGGYIYSPQSVRQYEMSQSLKKAHVKNTLTTHLRSRRLLSTIPTQRTTSEGRLSRVLLPVVHRLKWCIRRDQLAKVFVPKNSRWLVEGSGKGLWEEHEGVRLAICPGVRGVVGYFETISK